MKNKVIILATAIILASCSLQKRDTIFIEAESFINKGGWVVDAQFIDKMGSSYLMAHGLGNPVKDATTTIEFPIKGKYYVYVRTWNWNSPWNPELSPGIFQVIVNDSPIDTVFGRMGQEWSWIYGGTTDIKHSKNRIALHDLTGFNGRCDAIIFTKDSAIILPNNNPELYAFRKKLLRRPNEAAEAGDFDLVVVGGGIAGICLAISAARMGLKVALIQNRPVLGGNNSSEVRVHLMGSIADNRYPKLGKIVRELDTGDPGNAGHAEAYGDHHKLDLVRNEKNIKLFLNTHISETSVIDGRIISVTGRNIETNEELKFNGRWFADCTGDGNLGYMAGADYAYGREGRDETGESLAPEIPDEMTMGSSNLWYASEKDYESEFPELPWAFQFSKDYYLDQTRADWRWEAGFQEHTINQAEYIRDLNLRAIFGNWSYLKNHQKEKYARWKLDWVAYIAGKRESRRLLGDVILTQQDIQEKKEFPDACVTTTWAIDLHFPDSLNTRYYPGQEFYSWYEHPAIEPYEIPYRCLYSRNIENLFMAGRCISVTHVALGTVRVMRTGGMMGEVVGMAASLCKKHDTNPRYIYQEHLEELISLMHDDIH